MRIFIQEYEGNPDVQYDKHYTENMFYTDDGLYRYHLHKLYRQNFQTNRYESISYRHYTFLIDHTTFEDGEILYHIPFKHRFCEEHYSIKDLGQGLTFVKKQCLDQISYYFEYKGKLESFVFPKMFTFLM
jgi:hypothetical protein